MENKILTTPHLAKLKKSLGGNSLLRRSLIKNSNIPNANEELNDDDAERSSLVASERAVMSSLPVGSPRSDSDIFSGELHKEHYQGCLKLYAENKITKDNAWNLQLIDFMSSMLRRHDARMANMQTASTMVDASARIYAFRVDGVHHDVLKMAGGLAKASQAKRGKKDDQFDDDQDDAFDSEAQTQVKKKKKKAKGAIASNLETLNGDFESNDLIDPFFERLAATPGDVTSSNRAFNVTLPINDKTLALILRTDDRFLESIKENESEEIDLSSRITISTKLLPAFLDSDIICEPFSTFSISNWDPETEDTDTNRIPNWVEENRLNLSQQALAFDVNAEVEPIPVEDQEHDLHEDEPLAGISSDEEADVAVAASVARVPAAPAVLCRRTDMRPSAPADSRLEYSYCGAIVTAWAGPSHWKLKNNRASKLSHIERTHTTAAAGVKHARIKRQLDFLGAGLAFDYNTPCSAEFEPTAPSKITISRKTLATGNTWKESNFRTPIDRGLDEMHFRKLYLRKNVIMLKKKELGDTVKVNGGKADSVHVTEAQAHAYDLNNENDMSYCPTSQDDGDDGWGNEDVGHEEEVQIESNGLGDMVEPPTKIQKYFIPYAMRAKKFDMKYLKKLTWGLLTEERPKNQESDDEERDIQPTTFFTLFFKLREKLSPTLQESVSISIALLAVLHLANEKGLRLESQSDLKDFKILGLAKFVDKEDD